MTPIQYIIQYLRAELTDLEGRIWPLLAPQRNDTWPAVTIQEDSLLPEGVKGFTGCLDSHLMQVNVFATSYKEGHELGHQIRTLLADPRHFQPDDSPGIASINFDQARDGLFDVDARLYHRILTYTIDHKIIEE